MQSNSTLWPFRFVLLFVGSFCAGVQRTFANCVKTLGTLNSAYDVIRQVVLDNSVGPLNSVGLCFTFGT